MVPSNNNTLIIVEGELEKEFFDRFSEVIKKDKNIEVIPFRNNIYKLYNKIKELGETTTIDVIKHCFKIDDDIKQKINTTKFVSIYLIFDLDVQDGYIDEKEKNLNIATKMLELFNDETGEYGKLFINYPMMESFKDFKFSNYETLNGKTIKAEYESLIHYKETVGKEGTTKDVNSYNLNDFYIINSAHLMQANLLINNKFTKPTMDEYENIIDINKIHEKQLCKISNENRMLILNTSSFIYSEFYPQTLQKKN